MTAFEVVIGLEVHVQLATQTKLFCGCRATFGSPPNTAVCPVCTGMPGALPVPSRAAFEFAARFGDAVGAEIATRSAFDRKHYFYPDLPKGYQITQHTEPVLRGGALPLPGGRDVALERAHLEEDAGKSTYDTRGNATLVDLNRAGISLLEIVTAPTLRSPAETEAFLRNLRLLVRHLRISDGDMEKGSLRADVNVSLRPLGASAMGTRVEVKNLNSFRAVTRALEYEEGRQAAVLTGGGKVNSVTLGWDEERQVTYVRRHKETDSDYRYLRDPDLPPVTLPQAMLDAARATRPPTPWEREAEYRAAGLADDDVTTLLASPDRCDRFEEACLHAPDVSPTTTARLLLQWIPDGTPNMPSARDLAEVAALLERGVLGNAGARRVIEALVDALSSGSEPELKELIDRLGARQESSLAALEPLVRAAIEENPTAVRDLADGKENARNALVGAVMRRTRGSADPAVVRRLLGELLG